MDHGEALQMMAAERYLLNELTPEERDAFEVHMFGCQECALDIRAGAAFIREAKTQLFEMESQGSPSVPAKSAGTDAKKKGWSFLWQPAFAMPAFAVMIALIAFQNIATIPSLRRSATEPRILYSNPMHVGTRGSTHMPVRADRTNGLSLSIELPQSPNYSSFVFELDDSSGKKVWTQNVTASNAESDGDGVVSLIIPGSGLQQSSYTLNIWAVTPQNSRVDVDRRTLDVQFGN